MKQSPVLTEKQVKQLLSSTKMTRHSTRNRLIVILSYHVGLRSCEICSLTVGDVVDGEGNIKDTVILKSHQTKGNKSNSVYLSDTVKDEIRKYFSEYSYLTTLKQSSLLQSQKGGGFSSMTIQHLFKKLYKSIGLDDCSSHSGRRTMITQLAEKGVSVRVIQELARHSDLSTTQRYIDVSVDKLRNAVSLVSF